MEKSSKRKPAQERWINELSDQDLQKYVRVLGATVDIKAIQEQNQEQLYIIVDDGTGRLRVTINKPIPLELGNKIRIFGILEKTEQNDYIIEAEIIQNMKDLDMELYKRVREVKRRFKDRFERAE
jgi:hypothetical protein